MNNENIDNEIAKIAYKLWEKGGYVQGRDRDNWLEAEQIVLMKNKGTVTSEKKQKKAAAVERMPVELKKTSSRATKKEAPEKKAAPKKTATKTKSPKESHKTK